MTGRPASDYIPGEIRAFRIQMVVGFVSVTAIAGIRPTTSYRALDLGADAFQVGLVQAAFSLLPALTAVALGRWIDRHGAGRPYTAALFMLGGLTVVEASLGGLLDNVVGRLLALLVLSAAGGAVYLVTATALRAPELAQLRDHLRRRRSARSS